MSRGERRNKFKAHEKSWEIKCSPFPLCSSCATLAKKVLEYLVI